MMNHRLRFLLRFGWLSLLGLFIIVFVSHLPNTLSNLSAASDNFVVEGKNLQKGLEELGISEHDYAVFHIVRIAMIVFGFLVLSTILILKSGRSLFLVLFGFILALVGLNFATSTFFHDLLPDTPWTAFVGNITFASIFFCWYFFPDGQFVPGWTRWLFLSWWIATFLISFYEGQALDPNHWPALISIPFRLVLIASGPAALIYRYMQKSDNVQRQQIKWVAFGIAIFSFFFIAFWTPVEYLGSEGTTAVFYDMVGGTLLVFSFLLIPTTIFIALARYHLWGIDRIFSQATKYLTLSTIIILLYLLLVDIISQLIHDPSNRVGAILAAGISALALNPLRSHLQNIVNRIFYGERDDPYGILVKLGNRLENTISADEILPTITKTLRDSLRLPYAAVHILNLAADQASSIDPTQEFRAIAESGEPPTETTRVPLNYRGHRVGNLVLGCRAPGEKFNKKDMKLIEGIAFHASAAVNEIIISGELSSAQTRLAVVREEERHLLRQELHDRIGPLLAGIIQRISSLIPQLEEDQDFIELHLLEVSQQVKRSINDIRRLAHGFGPLILDELGLASALREFAKGVTTTTFTMQLEIPDPPAEYPAAISTAIYHIVLESVNNVIRHANARNCQVRIFETSRPNPCVRIEIVDDGVGFPKDYTPGLGIGSMQQRVFELGGAFEILPSEGTGSTIVAEVPTTFFFSPQADLVFHNRLT